MKSILLIIVSVLMLTLSGYAQNQLQAFGKYTEGGEVTPDVNFFGYAKKLDSAGKFQVTYFALIEPGKKGKLGQEDTPGWGEGMVGLSAKLFPWCELGVMFGLETVPSTWRGAASIWLGQGKYSFYTCVEKGIGTGNWWYKSVATYTANPNFSFGAMSWRYSGTGPYFKYTHTKSGLGLWVNPVRDFEFQKNRVLIGVDLNF